MPGYDMKMGMKPMEKKMMDQATYKAMGGMAKYYEDGGYVIKGRS